MTGMSKILAGYKQTEVGVIPEEWEVRAGKSVTTLITKGASPRWQGFTYTEDGLLFITSENVRDGFIDLSEPKYLPVAFNEKIKRSQVYDGDILVNLVGASIGRSCIAKTGNVLANVNQAVAVFRVVRSIESRFVALYLQTDFAKSLLFGLQVDAARQNISLSNLNMFPIPLPPLPEQKRIAQVLGDVDALIQKLEALIAKKRDIKQAAMQELLTGKRRLPGFSGPWETRNLGEIAEKIGSGITPTGGNAVYKASGRPFIRSQNIGWGCLHLDDIAFIDETTHATFSGTELRVKDVLLNITGASIGRCAVADESVVRGNVNQHVCIIRLFFKFAEPQFVQSYLLSPMGQSQIDSFQAGGNREGLNFAQIASFNIGFPPLPEQSAIAQVLSDMDSELAQLESRLAKTRDMKAGLMQELLTGRIRLV